MHEDRRLRRTGRVLVRLVVGVITAGLFSIGLAGVPDDWQQWGQWLGGFSETQFRVLLVIVASLILASILLPWRRWLKSGSEELFALVGQQESTNSIAQVADASPGAVQVGRVEVGGNLYLGTESVVDHHKTLRRAYRRLMTEVDAARTETARDALVRARNKCLFAIDEIEDAAEALLGDTDELLQVVRRLQRFSVRAEGFPGQQFLAELEALDEILASIEPNRGNSLTAQPSRGLFDVLADAQEMQSGSDWQDAADTLRDEMSAFNSWMLEVARALSSKTPATTKREKILQYGHVLEKRAENYVKAADTAANHFQRYRETLEKLLEFGQGETAPPRFHLRLAAIKESMARVERLENEFEEFVKLWRGYQRLADAFRAPFGRIIRATQRCKQELRAARTLIQGAKFSMPKPSPTPPGSTAG